MILIRFVIHHLSEAAAMFLSFPVSAHQSFGRINIHCQNMTAAHVHHVNGESAEALAVNIQQMAATSLLMSFSTHTEAEMRHFFYFTFVLVTWKSVK